ncbi:hypothetical protein KPH14_010811 [Odynerus spinipes]|uniref:Uncharacterized protein n=1 Tax=Odynerus spinipes TaxID=1348599 RepID=A0AAD9VMR9_9HYME|nr:hypothetical protein KPH14_010811 [Odynerus spinipes]
MDTVNSIVHDSNLPILSKRKQICMAIDKNTGEICGETDSLQILDEFRKLYEARIEKVDSESASEFDRVSMKCQIMTEWIKDLGEQNVMLVHTVKDLEQTASDRVKLLEEKLKQSSNIVSDKIVQSSQSEEALCLLSNRIRELENDEECFRQRIEFLQTDIKGLLELIKRAQDNRWSLDGIKLYCIDPSEIPTPLDCPCTQEQIDIDQIQFLKQQVAKLECDERKARAYQIKLEEQNAELTKELLAKEETIQTHVSEIQSLSDKLKRRSKLANHNNIESTSVSTNSDVNVQKRMINYVTEIPEDIISNPITTQQFKLMEEFRVCTVEVQAATEDIREEINIILSSFTSQQQKYNELSNVVRDTQEQLMRMQEAVLQGINKLKLQEIERMRYTERIMAEKVKLKDIKNEFIRAQSELFHYIKSIQEKIKEHNLSECAEMYAYNDLLNFVVDEVELIVNHVQVLQEQECFFVSTLTELKEQLCCTTCTLQGLQKHMTAILQESKMEETILCEREKRLGKLEAEIESAHTRLQDTLETLWSTREQCDLKYHLADSQSQNQTINELLKAKEDIHKLRKEYDDFKLKMLEKTCQAKTDDKINQWKCRAMDLEDQLRILQHETKCKQETNHFLKSSIESMEKELCTAQTKAENCRRSHSIDSIDYKKKILELENTIKIQKEVETKLKKSLDNNEMELQKSRELLESFHMECNPEGSPMCCGYQFKHENTSQLANILQEAVQSTKNGLQDIECELKKLVCEESCRSGTSENLVMTVIDKVKKYEEQLDKCYEDIGNLRNTLCSKDKLIDMQNLIIAQYEKEKKDLSKQNELQAQTIGHLQNAVVEAKRCLDSMGHKAVSDLLGKGETIQLLTMFVDETQNQYSECFTEAAAQEKLLELQRDAITTLQLKIQYMIYDKNLIVTSLRTTYCSILSIIQDQLKLCANDFQALKCKINALTQTKICLENKYITTKKLWQKADQELQELKAININKYVVDLEAKQEEIKNLQLQVERNECLIDKQAQTIEQLQKKLHTSEQQIKQFISESTTFKERFLSVKMLLKEKSDSMAKLEADYEVLKNENTILKIESVTLENKAKEDLCLLRKKLKESQAELSFVKDNYNRTVEDLKKAQENLIKSVKREAELQESLTIAEKKFCSKIANSEIEITRLENIIHKFDEELSDNKKKLSLKNTELCKAQNICKSFAAQLETVQQDLYESREKYIKMENSSCHLAQQLQECIDENFTLLQQKTLLEQDNCKFVNELQNMYKSLMELKKECQSKDESLACMSAELTQTVVNRSELCNESQYMVSCIRTWMGEQRKFSQTLASKLQMKQQQLTTLKQRFGHEKKALLVTIRELRQVNNILAQRLKRLQKTTIGKNTKSAGYYIIPSYVSQNLDKSSMGPIKAARWTSVCGKSWWFPKMEYLTNELRKTNQWQNTSAANRSISNSGMDENRDCGYQSSASK